MLKINHHQRKILSSFLAGIYVLLMLFASSLHEHHHSIFKNVDAPKYQKQFTASHDDILSSDCWSCHFLGNHEGIIPQEFNFEAYNLATYFVLDNKSTDNWITIPNYTYPLRGPPSLQVL